MDAYRYTAGVSGVNDRIYDFTQLVSGNIAFVGSWGTEGGVWAIVTDSTGAKILWEKQVRIPFRSAGGTGVDAYSVAAAPDSGFTVVGPYFLPDSLGGQNAFAVHFVPKPLPATVINRTNSNFRRTNLGHTWDFTFDANQATDAELRLFTVEGKMAAHYSKHMPQSGQGEFRVDASQLKAGIYLWEFRVGSETTKGLMTLSE